MMISWQTATFAGTGGASNSHPNIFVRAFPNPLRGTLLSLGAETARTESKYLRG